MTVTSETISQTRSKEWQRPFVNVFKICGVESYKDAIKEGDVKSEMDRTIGRRVIKISGKIPAVNFLQVPGVKGRALGLTGRYLYLQIRIDPSCFFTIHLEVSSADRNTTRISFSNLFKTKPCTATPQPGCPPSSRSLPSSSPVRSDASACATASIGCWHQCQHWRLICSGSPHLCQH